MKTNWTYILGALIIGTLSLSACGKKGGGSTATPPTGGTDNNTPPGTQTTSVRGNWQGYISFNGSEGRQLMKALMKKSGKCQGGASCKFDGAAIRLQLFDQTLPGRGQISIRTYKYWGINNWAYVHQIQRFAQALPETNGFQITYNVNGGQWYGGHVWQWQGGGQHCYWKQVQQQPQNQFYIGLGLTSNNFQFNGGYQQGYGVEQSQYVCEDVTPMYASQSQMDPQVIDPNQQSMTQNFWIGYQVQAVAEFKDSTKTCILVKLYYMGQLIGSAELQGTVGY